VSKWRQPLEAEKTSDIADSARLKTEIHRWVFARHCKWLVISMWLLERNAAAKRAVRMKAETVSGIAAKRAKASYE